MPEPFKTIAWDSDKLKTLTALAVKRHIPYDFGGKHGLKSRIDRWNRGIDCSGWVRYLFWQCAELNIPDGSWNQARWAKEQGFKHYGKTGYLLNARLKDNRLRLCQFAGNPGHIWFVLNGVTYESYGGHGPGSRKWNTVGLVARVQNVFVLTEPPGG